MRPACQPPRAGLRRLSPGRGRCDARSRGSRGAGAPTDAPLHVRSAARWATVVVPLLFAAGALEAAPAGVTNLVWPLPPAPPRIAFVRSIAGPTDVGVKPPTFSRVANWITGAKKGLIELERPFGLALDESGNLLMTDTGANAVCCFDPAHKKWLRWEQAGKTRFESPVAVARRGSMVYVADSGLGKVLAFELGGQLKFEITRELERPAGLAFLGERLYIADPPRHQIVICDARGGFLSKFGQRGGGPGEFNFPTHLAAAPGNRLLVTDSLNRRIQVFSDAGQFERVIGSPGDGPGRFNRPKGVAADSFGHIYVVDALFDNVQVFDQQGRLLLPWGEPGPDPGQFWLPNGIVISPDNEIYVADSYNHRVQVFKYLGKE